jgi:hypothetical protein
LPETAGDEWTGAAVGVTHMIAPVAASKAHTLLSAEPTNTRPPLTDGDEVMAPPVGIDQTVAPVAASSA